MAQTRGRDKQAGARKRTSTGRVHVPLQGKYFTLFSEHYAGSRNGQAKRTGTGKQADAGARSMRTRPECLASQVAMAHYRFSCDELEGEMSRCGRWMHGTPRGSADHLLTGPGVPRHQADAEPLLLACQERKERLLISVLLQTGKTGKESRQRLLRRENFIVPAATTGAGAPIQLDTRSVVRSDANVNRILHNFNF